MKLNTCSALLVVISLITHTVSASELENNITSKEVYNFKSKSGTPVFTDMMPKNHPFKTQTITTAKSNEQVTEYHNINPSINNSTEITHNTTTVIHQYSTNSRDKSSKKIRKNRCKYFKHQLELVTDKMKAGYRPSEYKRLEKERVKFRSLVFEKCDSRVN